MVAVDIVNSSFFSPQFITILNFPSPKLRKMKKTTLKSGLISDFFSGYKSQKTSSSSSPHLSEPEVEVYNQMPHIQEETICQEPPIQSQVPPQNETRTSNVEENNQKFPLAGQKNILRNIEREAKELAFATSADEVDSVFENQDEFFFFRGPRQWRQRGVAVV
ncbi:uncharacterized protein LOC141608496 [Silene latifolia]|uniref:uncharacterized protein LOC141608496 n=1 Tax=Silene latifolia TaxID=37657 RepID=UPI003D779D3D